MLRMLTRVGPKPSPLKVAPAPDLTEEYRQLNVKLRTGFSGVTVAGKLRCDVADFLWEKGVELYDFDHVVEYMERVAWKAGKELFWAPLRDDDSNARRALGSTYSKPVPVEVLRNVDAIVDKFRAQSLQLQFLVTDYRVPDPDPFIAVDCRGWQAPIVFGCWDEPSYTLGVK
jgi:hypothetical protein